MTEKNTLEYSVEKEKIENFALLVSKTLKDFSEQYGGNRRTSCRFGTKAEAEMFLEIISDKKYFLIAKGLDPFFGFNAERGMDLTKYDVVKYDVLVQYAPSGKENEGEILIGGGILA